MKGRDLTSGMLLKEMRRVIGDEEKTEIIRHDTRLELDNDIG